MRFESHLPGWAGTLASAAIFGAAYFFGDRIGELDGYLHPVASPIVLISYSNPNDMEHTVWAAASTKLRDCKFLGIEWFLGERGGRSVHVNAFFADKPQVRGKGELYWDGLTITLNPQQTFEASYADVLHDCGMPWTTRTRLFDPSQI